MPESESRSWADLPAELAHLISKKLPLDRAYLLTFRAVCKNWRSAVPLSHPQPQLPWLIERDAPLRNSYLGPKLRFYSLAGGDTGTITVPKPYQGMAYYGPGNGYLFVSSLKDDLSLVNLLTGDLISLPYTSRYAGYRDFRILSAFCSGSDPLHNWHIVSHFVMDGSKEIYRYVIYHAVENDWKSAQIASCSKTFNTCCWDGKLYVMSKFVTMIMDVVSGHWLYAVKPPVDKVRQNSQTFRNYVVESCGEILNVTWYLGSNETEDLGVGKFSVYKLYSEEGEQHKRYSWVKVHDIGDQILFLDLMNGFSVRAPAGFKGNCIYFLLDDGNMPCRYDLGTGIVEMLPCPFKNCTWFIPNLG